MFINTELTQQNNLYLQFLSPNIYKFPYYKFHVS